MYWLLIALAAMSGANMITTLVSITHPRKEVTATWKALSACMNLGLCGVLLYAAFNWA